jgi:hypothetical protein
MWNKWTKICIALNYDAKLFTRQDETGWDRTTTTRWDTRRDGEQWRWEASRYKTGFSLSRGSLIPILETSTGNKEHCVRRTSCLPLHCTHSNVTKCNCFGFTYRQLKSEAFMLVLLGLHSIYRAAEVKRKKNNAQFFAEEARFFDFYSFT